MALKKTSKGKGVAAEPTRKEGSVPSKCSNSDLETLVSDGLLPEKSVIQWRPALGEDRPYENTGEIIAFYILFGTRIGVSLSVFLLWAPALLQDLAPPFNPKFLCSYFYLHAFVQSFSGHRAPF